MSFLKREKISLDKIFRLVGILLIFCGLSIFIKIYFPIATAEVKYQVSKTKNTKQEIIPINTDFSIVIPKIGVNTFVSKNIDPNNPSEYQKALTRGVAHAKTSTLPGFSGNVFIFAHSAADWYQANQYNAIFYLINKLEAGDQIIIYYQNSKYLYTVSDKKIVNATETNYLSSLSPEQTLTLMTCWPPGTTLNRLIVIAKM